MLGPGVKTGIPIRYDDPREVGPGPHRERGRRAERYGAPCIVVDFGTSTNFDVVSADGEYVGGVLAPGIEISMDALFERAARLLKVDFVEPPTVIGKTTVAASSRASSTASPARSTASSSASAASSARDAQVVATGGLAELIAPHARRSSGSTVPDTRGPAARMGAEPRGLSGAVALHPVGAIVRISSDGA